jgi:hypothetical protein
LALTSPTSGGRSVSIVRLRTTGHYTTEAVFVASSSDDKYLYLIFDNASVRFSSKKVSPCSLVIFFSCYIFAVFLLVLLFDPKDGSYTILRDVDKLAD